MAIMKVKENGVWKEVNTLSHTHKMEDIVDLSENFFLPPFSPTDHNKFLTVQNGVLTWITINTAEDMIV